MENFDYSKPCSTCQFPENYCATYIGPKFQADSKRKIFFIGLDSGCEGNGELCARAWQESVLSNYREDEAPWNWHYKACIAITSDIHGLSCQTGCKEKCSGCPAELCALTHFAQGNAVKCVHPGSRTKEFKQQHLIFFLFIAGRPGS